MKKHMMRPLFPLLLIAAVLPVCSQIVVEPDVVTDSIDVFAGSAEPTRSRATATFISLLIPGLGHQYLGDSRRALAYFSAEALFVAGLVFSERQSRRLFTSSRAYAWSYAGAACADKTDYYWQNVGRFMDSDEYNRIMELNRTPEDKYAEETQQWRWIDEVYKDDYNDLRESATRFHVASSFFIAAMVLDRAIAFIDIRRRTRYKGIQGSASSLELDIHPRVSLHTGKAGLAVTGQF